MIRIPLLWAGCCALLGLAGLPQAVAADAAALRAPLDRPASTLRDTHRVAMLGIARAGGRLIAVGERGAVLLSDDEGSSWRQASAVPVSATLTGVQFVDPHIGWAVGHYGVVLRSDDGGEHWKRQLDGIAIARLALAEARASGNARALADAERVAEEGADKPLLALQFANGKDGLVAGAFGLLLATRDGGETWQSIALRLDNPKGAHLYALYRQGDTVLITGEQGLLLHSADDGMHFERVVTPYKGSLFCVAREAGGAWLLAGLRGNAWRSRDGGKTWAALASPAPESFTALSAEGPEPPWLLNQGGQLLAALSDPDRLVPVAVASVQQPAQMLRLADGSVLVVGWSGITRVSPRPTEQAGARSMP